jgi:hypothetical protein
MQPVIGVWCETKPVSNSAHKFDQKKQNHPLTHYRIAQYSAMGKRSTLLRLEATIGATVTTAVSPTAKGKRASNATTKTTTKTEIMHSKEDHTSIIDVVTGGGQDCAV